MISRSGPVDFGVCVCCCADISRGSLRARAFVVPDGFVVGASLHIDSLMCVVLAGFAQQTRASECMLHLCVPLILISVECISLHIGAVNVQFRCSTVLAAWRRGSRYQQNVCDDAAPLFGISLFWRWFMFAI